MFFKRDCFHGKWNKSLELALASLTYGLLDSLKIRQTVTNLVKSWSTETVLDSLNVSAYTDLRTIPAFVEVSTSLSHNKTNT